ncbi:MAG: hypothetical protein HUU54_03175 [Ignavibacteriaceae bacterium]|nr:hypothetical protein [Ignavibacteriaceae bacterium]
MKTLHLFLPILITGMLYAFPLVANPADATAYANSTPADSARRGGGEKTKTERVPKGENNAPKRDEGSESDSYDYIQFNNTGGSDPFMCMWDWGSKFVINTTVGLYNTLTNTEFRKSDTGIVVTRDNYLPYSGLMVSLNLGPNFLGGSISEEYNAGFSISLGSAYIIQKGFGVEISYELQASIGGPKYDYSSEVTDNGTLIKTIQDSPNYISYSAEIIRIGAIYRIMPSLFSTNTVGLHFGIFGAIYSVEDYCKFTRTTDDGIKITTEENLEQTFDFIKLVPGFDLGLSYRFSEHSPFSAQWKLRYDFISRKGEEKSPVPMEWGNIDGNFSIEAGIFYTF